MKKKLVLAVFGLMMLAAFIGIAKAQINVTLTLTDASNTPLASTVPMNTIVYAHGFYENLEGGGSASALMEVYYDNGTGTNVITTLYTGSINSGQKITRTYQLTKPGNYEFRWTCTRLGGGFQPFCHVQRGFVNVRILTLPIPEPGTIAGLIMALSAFGLLAIKKAKH